MERRSELSDRSVDAVQSVLHRLLGGDVLYGLARSKWYRFMAEGTLFANSYAIYIETLRRLENRKT